MATKDTKKVKKEKKKKEKKWFDCPVCKQDETMLVSRRYERRELPPDAYFICYGCPAMIECMRVDFSSGTEDIYKQWLAVEHNNDGAVPHSCDGHAKSIPAASENEGNPLPTSSDCKEGDNDDKSIPPASKDKDEPQRRKSDNEQDSDEVKAPASKIQRKIEKVALGKYKDVDKDAARVPLKKRNRENEKEGGSSKKKSR